MLDYFNHMTITRRISLAFVWLLVLVVIMGGVGLWAVTWLNSWSSTYQEETLPQVTAASEIATGAASVGGFALAAVADRENTDQYKTALDEALGASREALDAAAAAESHGAEHAAELENLRVLIEQVNQGAQDAFAVIGTNPQRALDTITDQVMPLAQQLREAARSYDADEKAQEAEQLQGLTGTARFMMIGVIVVVALAIFLAAFLAIRISRSIRRQLGTAASSIGSSASQLQAVSAQVAAGAAQTAAATNETTATVEEVKQAAQLAHEKATEVADRSHDLAQVADTGRGAVEETLSGIERMRNEMGLVAETINRLTEQTQAVGDIITSVNDLAEQSNLLSVNASIEAAKAGDQGKGFGVVAQEVKSLAEQSKQAVTQVRSILGEIQKAGGLAVQAAERSRNAVEAARRQSVETGESAQSLAETANEAAQSAMQISASSRQQLAGMEQVSQAIESINQATTQSVSGTRQVEHEVEHLQDLALGLKRLFDAKATA